MTTPMKYASIILAALTVFISACSHDEPTGNVNLPIAESFLPANIVVDRHDTELLEECRKWRDKTLIVNSTSEIPDDPFGSKEAFSNINLNELSLLITYNVHSYNVLSYQNIFVRNRTDKTYDWTIRVGINGEAVSPDEQLIYTRYAILVKRLPAGATLRAWYSITDHNWDWVN